MAKCEWTAADYNADTYRPETSGGMCLAYEPHGGYGCTRPADHTGRHAAGTGVSIVAVWN